MKKVGILFGQENSFPQAFVDRVNAKKEDGITAEFVKIDKVMQAQPTGYAVIIDRISQDIPFYRGFLKNEAITGTAVINNPFWWSADEKFFNNALAEKLGIAVPKTVLLPSNAHPPNTDAQSMRNLAYPLDWDTIFSYVGFPAYLKPFSGGGRKRVFKVNSPEHFFGAYNNSGQIVMMLQEEIDFTEYFRCYCLDRKDVRVMQYDPKQPHHLRYARSPMSVETDLLQKIEKAVRVLNEWLGYDFNTVEVAVRDGVPYAIDFYNPAPDADVNSVGEENFEWVLETAASMAVRRAKAHVDGRNNLTWGKFVAASVNNLPIR
jgi:hypothetical protein